MYILDNDNKRNIRVYLSLFTQTPNYHEHDALYDVCISITYRMNIRLLIRSILLVINLFYTWEYVLPTLKYDMIII